MHTFFIFPYFSLPTAEDLILVHGCHQIRELMENQGILFLIREIRGKEDFLKNPGSREVLGFLLFRFNFSYAPFYIHLNVIVAQFCQFVYHSVLCSHCEAQFQFVIKPNI